MASSKDTAGQIDTQRMYLATGLVCAFVACILGLFLREVPPGNKDLVTYMIGQLSGMATMALGFYFVNKAGQDAADAQKSENTGKALDAITAAATANTTSGGPGAVAAADQVAEAAAHEADRIAAKTAEEPLP